MTLLNVFSYHEITIAKKSLQMPKELANILGQSHEQAQNVLKKHGFTDKQIKSIKK
jgi:beta-lactam-binding protein with PASTA domain